MRVCKRCCGKNDGWPWRKDQRTLMRLRPDTTDRPERRPVRPGGTDLATRNTPPRVRLPASDRCAGQMRFDAASPPRCITRPPMVCGPRRAAPAPPADAQPAPQPPADRPAGSTKVPSPTLSDLSDPLVGHAVPGAAATAATAPCAVMRLAGRSRPWGGKRAPLCLFIRGF